MADDPIATSDDDAQRRVTAAIAGHLGREPEARRYLTDPSPVVRAAAFSALVRMAAVTSDDVAAAVVDASPRVRRVVCELAAGLPPFDLAPLLDDEDETVIEAAGFALGEVGDHRAVGRLAEIVTSHSDPMCRESAVAALGAIGDEAGRSAVLAALGDVPHVRRRAVIARAAFEGPDVDAALRERLEDRDWQVRQAAEDVLGINRGTDR